MKQVLVIYPADKRTAGSQICEGLRTAGYDVVTEEVALGTAIPDHVAGSGTVLVIWSRALASAAVVEGWLADLRRLSNVIEVSTDGIAPQSADDSRVVLLSGWRGQPYHLGWQRILTDLDRRGTRRSLFRGAGAAPETRNQVTAAAAALSAGGAGSKPTPARYGLPVAAALVLIGGLGAASWLTGSPASNGDKVSAPSARALASGGPPKSAAPFQIVPGPAPAPAPTWAAPFEATSAAPVSKAAPPATRAERPPPVRDASDGRGRSSAPKASGLKGRGTLRQPLLKRYSKKNSKVMRRFCARSGRGTAECRTFLRSIEAGRS
jgi:hypothetical protein